MNSLLFAALAAGTASSGIAVPQAGDSPLATSWSAPALLAPVAANTKSGSAMKGSWGGMRGGMRGSRWGGKQQGRWVGGWRAPGGWGAYRRPFRGYVLPRYWVNPSFSVINYPVYGLRAPSAGYNWYRYYDDAVMADGSGRVYDSVYGVDWDRYDDADEGYAEAEYGPRAGYDESSYGWDDRVYDDSDVDSEAGTYRGRWTGEYVDEDNRVYKGKWAGTYTDEDGRVYRGTYKGTAIGAPRYGGDGEVIYEGGAAGASYAPPPVREPVRDERYSYSRSIDGYERCRRDNGIGGAVAGGAVGAVAGAAIAGRGDRLGGALIGGGVGALTGLALQRAIKKCETYRPADYRGDTVYDDDRRYDERYRGRGYDDRYRRRAPTSYGWQGGYAYGGGYAYPGYYPAYYYPAPTTTTVVVQPGSSSTTTTTYYEESAGYTSKAKRPLKAKRYVKSGAAADDCYCN